MSAKATTWAISFRAGNPTAKGIMRVLADYADDRGCCWPSVKTICHEAEVKERAVRNWLKKWEEDGVICRIARTRGASQARTTNHIVLIQHRAELIALAIKKGTSLPEPIAGYKDPPAPDAPPSADPGNNTPLHEMQGEGARDAGGPCHEMHPLKKNSNLQDPPLPPEAGGNGSVRLEGFDLFMSIWPEDWPGVRDSERKLRPRWRAAVDKHGAGAVEASARNYIAKAQASSGTKASVGWFLARKSGLVAKFLPVDQMPELQPADLGDSDEHRFLAECREAGAKEGAIRRYAKPGAIRFVRHGAVTALVVDDRIDEFNAEFGKVINAHGLSVWTETYAQTYAQRRLEKKGKVA